MGVRVAAWDTAMLERDTEPRLPPAGFGRFANLGPTAPPKSERRSAAAFRPARWLQTPACRLLARSAFTADSTWPSPAGRRTPMTTRTVTWTAMAEPAGSVHLPG